MKKIYWIFIIIVFLFIIFFGYKLINGNLFNQDFKIIKGQEAFDFPAKGLFPTDSGYSCHNYADNDVLDGKNVIFTGQYSSQDEIKFDSMPESLVEYGKNNDCSEYKIFGLLKSDADYQPTVVYPREYDLFNFYAAGCRKKTAVGNYGIEGVYSDIAILDKDLSIVDTFILPKAPKSNRDPYNYNSLYYNWVGDNLLVQIVSGSKNYFYIYNPLTKNTKELNTSGKIIPTGSFIAHPSSRNIFVTSYCKGRGSWDGVCKKYGYALSNSEKMIEITTEKMTNNDEMCFGWADNNFFIRNHDQRNGGDTRVRILDFDNIINIFNPQK